LTPIRCTGKATLPVEVLATIRLPKNRRIKIDRALESLLDDLGVGAEYTDAIFIQFVRTTEKG
jgi:hypothetical protein